MACYHQLRAYKTPEGKISWPRIGAKQTEHETAFPLRLKCGQCIGCRLERTRSWAIRAVHEAQMHKRNSFLTLTYAEDQLPENRSLDVEHWQKFAKKVRNHCGPFRFLHSGEYSPAPNFRPHYHALIFGHDWAEERVPLKTNGNHPLWVSPILARLWPSGHHSIGALTFGSASYVASYCLKKLTGEYAERENERVDAETGEVWDVSPEYATMSRRPGLGKKWFDKYHADVYPSDECIIEGKSLRPPAYYDELLKKTNKDLHTKVETKRRNSVRQNAKNHTDERLEIRKEIAQAKLQLKQHRG